MTNKSFTFGEQLVVGSGGEQTFLERYPDPLVLSLDMRWDFTRLKDGTKARIKKKHRKRARAMRAGKISLYPIPQIYGLESLGEEQ